MVLRQEALGKGQPVFGDVQIRGVFHPKMQVSHAQHANEWLRCKVYLKPVYSSRHAVHVTVPDESAP
jgi:hypothetical protein